MSRDEHLYLDDIIERCERLTSCFGPDFSKRFLSDPMFHDGVLMQLTVIGEAVKNVSKSRKDAHPEIPWRKIAGLRDIIVHVYYGVRDEYILEIIEKDIETLHKVVTEMSESI
ncbi:MAG: DUF86 domain-containing protein [Fimbriimonas sp.]|nr:DUF86 domain-containing protein [Fimbriimonas sp.]